MISLRLKVIADLIPSNVRVIDVGCDHALLDIYLVEKDQTITCLATDINQNSLNCAIKNINLCKHKNRIETLLTNGLNNIDISSNDYIVISGMGTNTIKSIIEPVRDKINNIIIQSNHDLDSIREFMFNNGYTIVNEEVIYDKRYYIIMQFCKKKYQNDETDIWLGPIIKKSNNIDYFKHIKNKYKKILETIPTFDKKRDLVIQRISYLDELIGKK